MFNVPSPVQLTKTMSDTDQTGF